jgi:SAM-dependent methyltransferase
METSRLRRTPRPAPTRGNGALEPLLAYLRARQANRLIPGHLRQGRVLDIGCGSTPYFLSHSSFREKFAVDRLTPTVPAPDISWHAIDLNAEPALPFESGAFAVVTMLAVVEHLDPTRALALLGEVHRTLQPGGVLVVTTPAPWSNPLLRLMSRCNLVSAEEIDEHTHTYSIAQLRQQLSGAGFAREHMRLGYFELMLNLWGIARR